MDQPLSLRLLHAGRAMAPFFLSLLIVMILSGPYGLPGISSLSLVFALCTVFYWSIYRPDILPVGMVFALGLFLDLLGHGPFGVNALILLLAHAFTLSQRRALADKGHWMIWLGQITIAMVCIALYWMIHSLFYLQVMEVAPMGGLFLATILLYPVVAEFFTVIRIRLLKI